MPMLFEMSIANALLFEQVTIPFHKPVSYPQSALHVTGTAYNPIPSSHASLTLYQMALVFTLACIFPLVVISINAFFVEKMNAELKDLEGDQGQVWLMQG